MIQTLKKISLQVSVSAVVLGVSGLGVATGKFVTRHVMISTAEAASFTAVAASGAATSSKEGGKASLTSTAERYENLELFQKVLHFVEANYVEPVKNRDLVWGAIKGMLETLDSHSNFLTPDYFREMKTDTSGKFGGLGIEIGMKDNILTVMAPIEDTPAWKAGVKAFDRIVKINNESTKGMSLVEAVSKMRGKRGTDVTLSVYREGWDKIREIKITRDIIKIQSVKTEELEPQYGYVRLTSFNESASADIKKALENFEKKQKLRGLVFDLRGNPGGLLDQAVEVASLFIDNGVVVSTIGRNKDQKEVKHALKGNARKDFPVAVLVNSSSASAAEIVASALQDHHRAIIMGQPTFGKGSVQTVIDLGNDLGLKLTIARYYTPSGRSIQEKGVMPDIMLDDFDPKLLAEARRKTEYFREKDLKGHLVNTDPEEAKDGKEDKDTKKDNRAEYKREELDALSKGGKKKSTKGAGSATSTASSSSSEDDELAPIRMNPKEDFQVKEALGYLKSYEIFRKLAVGSETAAAAAAAASVQKTSK